GLVALSLRAKGAGFGLGPDRLDLNSRYRAVPTRSASTGFRGVGMDNDVGNALSGLRHHVLGGPAGAALNSGHRLLVSIALGLQLLDLTHRFLSTGFVPTTHGLDGSKAARKDANQG